MRLVRRAAEIIRNGGIVACPTDSCYALSFQVGNKAVLNRVRAIRQLEDNHKFTLLCADLSQISVYAQISNTNYRLLKAHTPGPYTFILKTTRDVPRYLVHPKRKTIGIRIPDNALLKAMLKKLDGPMMSTSLIPEDCEVPLSDPQEIRTRLEHRIDLVIAGDTPNGNTTVVALDGAAPRLVRPGLGAWHVFTDMPQS